MYREIDTIAIDHCFVSIEFDRYPGTLLCDICTEDIPLSLYSLGSSFLALMLNDEDVLESAYADL